MQHGYALRSAVEESIELWAHPKYRRFLRSARPGSLTLAWFLWFLNEWRVARTIGKRSKRRVRRYFDITFRRNLNRGDKPSVIDAAARHLQKRRWSSQEKLDGTRSLPLSLVSKVGFILSKGRIMPLDSYALRGLKVLLMERGQKAPGAKYADYLEAFDAMMEDFRAAIDREIQLLRTRRLARALHCRASILRSDKFRRKVFDSFLVSVGGTPPR